MDSPAPAEPARPRRRHGRLIVLGLLVLVSAAAGATMGTFLRFDLPDVSSLADYSPPVTTRVLDGNGEVLETFAEQKRVVIAYKEIPALFLQALLATEDSGFYEHTGIDLKGIARALLRDLRSLRLAQGASTLTQQLARNLFLHPDKTLRRKLQEAMLAMEIERQYTKEEILRFYCNQVYMGHGRYGLEAASQFYFDKPAGALTLTQAATIAGLIQRPSALSPRSHPERALNRRKHVLGRMVDVGYIDRATYEEAVAAPLGLADQDPTSGKLAPYFVEEIRRWLQERHGTDSLYTAGLQVTTTLDPTLQGFANQAVEHGLRSLDKRQGWRGVIERVPDAAHAESWESPGWNHGIHPGEVYDGVVLQVERESARIRVGGFAGGLDREAVNWTGRADLRKLFGVRDVIRVRVSQIGEDGELGLSLEQEPLVEGALVAIDPRSGGIRALVGGFDFRRSEFNRVMQAKRQAGSSFKPFIYAAALREGRSLASRIQDEPTVFLDPSNPQPYQPENFSKQYYGQTTLRASLERSGNIATVKLLNEIGYAPVLDVARRLGFGRNVRPFPSLALGAFESTLLELTSAYSAFANDGVRVEPHLVHEVRDRDDSLLDAVEPQVHDAVSPQVAYLMSRALRGVVTDGTGRAAADLPFTVAGKTGTTDDYSDAWFIGFAPNLAVGVWVGYDEPRPLGDRETGARAALPIWHEFMQQALASLPVEEPEMPPGIRVERIDRRTGLIADPAAYCTSVEDEYFIEGTEPSHSCSVFAHQLALMPYRVQRYPLDDAGVLVAPAQEFERLLKFEPTLRLTDGGRRLEYHGPDQTVTLAIRLEYGLERDPIVEPEVDPRLAGLDWQAWTGQDGRPATIVWFAAAERLGASR